MLELMQTRIRGTRSTNLPSGIPERQSHRFPTRAGSRRTRPYQREEMFGANSGMRWTPRYAHNSPIRIRQMGFQVHVYSVDLTP